MQFHGLGDVIEICDPFGADSGELSNFMPRKELLRSDIRSKNYYIQIDAEKKMGGK